MLHIIQQMNILSFGLKLQENVLWHNYYTTFLCLKRKNYVTI